MVRGAEVVAAELAAAGVDTVFGVMGEGNLELLACLTSDHGVRYVAARHEAGAVMMAWGYSRVAGRMGVATVTHGPGLTNALTAIVASARLPERVLVIAGSVSRANPGHVQALDHAAVLSAAGVETVLVADGAQVRAGCAQALTVARGVAVLDVPVDIQESEVGHLPATSHHPQVAPRLAAQDASLDAAADLLLRADAPLLLAGRGAVEAGAIEAIRRLARRCGALLGTTLLAAGAFAGDDRDLGVIGGFARPEVKATLTRCDALLAFGASLNPWTRAHGQLFSDVTVAHCDRDPAVIAGADVPLLGDAGAAAGALLERLPGTWDRATWVVPKRDPVALEPGRGAALHPRQVARALDEALPPERTLACDAGHFTGFPAGEIGVPDPRGGVYALGFGSVGLGLGAAVGAAVGRPDRRTVACVGDGGFLMALPELETAVRERLSLTVVVFDDSAYGAEVHHLTTRGLPPGLARFDGPPLSEVAAGLGALSVAVRTEADLRSADLTGTAERPVAVIDVHVDPTVVADWFTTLVQHAARQAGR